MTPEVRAPRRRDATWKLVVAFVTPLAVAVAAVVVISKTGDGSSAVPGSSPSNKPNVLVIMTDDQTLESMKVMANTNALLAAQGTTFSKFYVAFPNCCPSRATFLTGQYPHNNGVTDNVAPEGGFSKLRGDETLPVWLQRSGYYTASVGKYLNTWGQDGIRPPPGWSHWFGLIDPTTYHYYNYSVSNDGKRQDYGTAETDYQTDVLGAEVKRTITEAAASGRPWFVQWTPLTPHAQYSEHASTGDSQAMDESTIPVPPPRFRGRFANEPLPKPGSYNQSDMSGMPAFVASRAPITGAEEPILERLYRAELEALLAVDEWVGTLVKALEDTSQMSNTVIIFTSDNGMFHGEHRLPYGKVFLFEPATHVPLIVRGGPFPKGVSIDSMAVNADLAPTILGLAGATAGITLDGRDLVPITLNPSAPGRSILLESWFNQGRGDRLHMYAVHDGEHVLMKDSSGYEALFDLSSDPDQMRNRVDDPAQADLKAKLDAKLESLAVCAGPACG